jgi:hypothetical protein
MEFITQAGYMPVERHWGKIPAKFDRQTGSGPAATRKQLLHKRVLTFSN